MKKYLLILSALLATITAVAQMGVQQQYFDGDETNPASAIRITMDTSAGNIWQVGPPSKQHFNAAFTLPNALVTDTINPCPAHNISRFYFNYVPAVAWGVIALRWTQQLDLEPGREGAMIEYSTDKGATWENVFNNPHVYNFYGFSSSNRDTLPDGAFVFSGSDTQWKDVWLCFDISWLNATTDTLWFRYSLITDTVGHNRDGWMIDNLMIHLTGLHASIQDPYQTRYFDVYPNPVDKRIYLSGERLNQFHIIENMQLINVQGRVIKQWQKIPVKFYFDVETLPAGTYYLRIKTNVRTETFPVVIRH
ncbi:T9SS type A sorting domain-containing protein [Taibaiella koreensis]|uniref:T9SS type A sorting domain-containing protein n=1 Tax=Taibaiella koreensis TaxID=1268548 RepID=UPI0013C2E5CF|nr:T9SS type A sorting domain-containing protein [Taibaiella koreensis]